MVNRRPTRSAATDFGVPLDLRASSALQYCATSDKVRGILGHRLKSVWTTPSMLGSVAWLSGRLGWVTTFSKLDCVWAASVIFQN